MVTKGDAGRGRNLGPALARGAAGAVLGGAAGYVLFFWIARQGFYAIAIPGALLGIGCGTLSGRRSALLGAGCAVAALALGVYTEWRYAPFLRDSSLGFFIAHVPDLPGVKQALILVGAAIAFWFGRGRPGFRRGGDLRDGGASGGSADGGDTE